MITAPAQTSPDDVLAQLINLDTNVDATLTTDLTGELTVDTEAGADGLSAISGQMQQLRSYLDSLLNGLPVEQRPQIVEIKPAEFKQIISQLQADLNAGDPSLVATGLTPEKLASLMTQVETAEKNGTLESLVMVKIVAPETAANDKPVALLLPRALVAIQEQAQTGDDVAMTDGDSDAMAAALNKLVVGGDAESALKKPAAPVIINTVSAMAGGTSAEASADFQTQIEERSFADSEKSGQKETGTDGKNIPTGAEKAADKIKALIGAGLSTVMNSAPGSVETGDNWQDVFPDGMDMTTSVGLGGKPLGLNGATMTSLVTSAPQATYPHPATQAVAATITKAAAAGEDKAFNIKLDPPELGRVEVKMSIDKHNAVKAHLVIEKPETFMMLQRDAQILERSLQGIGLETGDGGLSFELAQDNMFQNEGDRGGERYQSGSKSAGGIEGAEDVIETTMTWHVDPETGMQRYNILV